MGSGEELPENIVHWSRLNRSFLLSSRIVPSYPSQARVQRHVSC